MENLWIAVYERGYIELDDVLGVQQWLTTLSAAKYSFPSFSRAKSSLRSAGTDTSSADTEKSLEAAARPTVRLLGHFNYEASLKILAEWSFARSRVVPLCDIVAYVPLGSSWNYTTSPTRVVQYEGDRGVYSPYLNLANEISVSVGAKISGILYVHDDMIR